MKLTIEEKYNFLLKNLHIKNIDFLENDAIIDIDPLYFHFSKNDVRNVESSDIDWAVEQAILDTK
jgi:hypothetical protein